MPVDRNEYFIWNCRSKPLSNTSSIRKNSATPKVRGRYSRKSWNYLNKKCGIILHYHLKIRHFFLLIINVFWPVDSESDVHFHRPKSENLDNLVKQKFSRSVVSELDRREWTPDLDSMGLITHEKCLSNPFHSHYPKNSESFKYRNKEIPVSPKRKPLINRKNLAFSDTY